MPPLSDRLRAANRDAWDATQAHRFVRDCEADALPRAVLGCAVATVTLGADGCLWADATGQSRRPAPAVRPVDCSGAGDVFYGALVARLADGATLAQVIPAAQAAAALSVTRFGAFAAIPATGEFSYRRQESG